MEEINKKKLANEKRLKAIKEWQKNQRNNLKSVKGVLDQTVKDTNNRIKHYDLDDLSNQDESKLKLFDSDEDEDNFNECFKIRPQFEGKHGQRMLEMNSKLSDRFKLDERFKEDENLVFEKDLEDSEKNKNIRILESILGHEVSKKHSIALSSKRKREIERFDPDNKDDTSCVKDVEKIQRKPKTKHRNPECSVSCNTVEVPYSSERYIEVTSNLKDIMSSASPFTFSEKFKLLGDTNDFSMGADKGFIETSLIPKKNDHQCVKKTSVESDKISKSDFECSSFKDLFFISDTDNRMKEGIEFFMRPKPLDEIRDEWQVKRTRILDIFKNRRKSAQRSSVKQPKNLSHRNKIMARNRKQHS